MVLTIRKNQAPTQFELRWATFGDVIELHLDARERSDIQRYAEAIGVGALRGAEVRWVR